MEDHKPQVLFITNWYPNERDVQQGIFVKKHAQAAANNNELVLLYLNAHPELKKAFKIRLEQDGFPAITVHYKKSGFPLINLIRRMRAAMIGLKETKKYQRKPTIVHANIININTFPVYLYCRWKRIPYVVSEHWSGYGDGRFGRLSLINKYLIRRIAKKAVRLMPVSDFLKQKMLDCGLQGQYQVLPNIVDVPKNMTVSERSKKERFKFLMVADLVDHIKNISGAIKAFAALVKTISDAELHIIGEGPDKKQLTALAAACGLKDTKIIFHKRRDHPYVLEVFPTCDALIVNSYIETFSIVTAEALSYGKPVIATRCGGPEYLVSSRTGILIPPDDPEQLKEAMQYMIQHNDDYSPDEIQASVKDLFNPKTIGKQIDEIYRDVLKKERKK